MPPVAGYAYHSAQVDQILQMPVEEVPAPSSYAAQPDNPVERHMQHIEATPEPQPQSWEEILTRVKNRSLDGDAGIQMEHQDQRHRMGRLLLAAHKIYKEQPRLRGFYEWLDGMPEWERVVMLSEAMKSTAIRCLGSVAQNRQLDKNARLVEQRNLNPAIVKAFIRGVAYIDQATRPSYRVEFQAGMAYYRGTPLDTSKMRTVFSGPGFGIWVMDPEGNIYAASHVLGQMHHSSFLAGNEIKAGGEFKAKNGRIELLSGKSGHYRPEMANLVGALNILKFRGVPIVEIRVLVWKDSTPALVSGAELVANPGQYKEWGHLNDQQKQWLQQENYGAFGKGGRSFRIAG